MRLLASVLLIVVMAACAPAPAPRASQAPDTGAPAASAPTGRSSTLITAIRIEPNSLASRLGLSGGATLTTTRRLFNAYLVIYDQKGDPQPYLATALPRANTDSWRVFDDGRM